MINIGNVTLQQIIAVQNAGSDEAIIDAAIIMRIDAGAELIIDRILLVKSAILVPIFFNILIGVL